MKNIRNFTIVALVLSLLSATYVPVNALDQEKSTLTEEYNSIESDNIQRSGGYISSDVELITSYEKGSYWKYTYLTDSWAPASSYTVSKNISVSSSSTLSSSLTYAISDDLKANFGITYGTTVSTSSSIGTHIPADSNRESRLRHKVRVKRYYVKVRITSTYYDTSRGYYTLSNIYSGYVTVPDRNSSTIYVQYR